MGIIINKYMILKSTPIDFAIKYIHKIYKNLFIRPIMNIGINNSYFSKKNFLFLCNNQ